MHSTDPKVVEEMTEKHPWAEHLVDPLLEPSRMMEGDKANLAW